MAQTMNPAAKATIARPPMIPNTIATVELVVPVAGDALLIVLVVSKLLLVLEEEEEEEVAVAVAVAVAVVVLLGKLKVAKNSSEPVPPE